MNKLVHCTEKYHFDDEAEAQRAQKLLMKDQQKVHKCE